MNERIQRNGRVKKVQQGATEVELTGYDVYDHSMRHIIGTFYGLSEAQAALERDVRMSKIACGSGACED